MPKIESFYIKIFLATFVYTLVAGLFIQLLLLPVILPHAHAGDGLRAGGDWVGYQRIAVQLAAEINENGWSAWQLRPEEQAPAGIAAAIYSITGIDKPWIILPLNALLHAASAIILLLIVKSVIRPGKLSIWPVLPFVFFPTALLWTTQIHKDGFFIFGAFLFLFGLLQLISNNNYGRVGILLSGFIAMIIGILSIWIVRPYGVEMVFYIGAGLAFLSTVYLVFNLKNNRRVIFNIIVMWLALLAAFPMTGTGIHHQYVNIDYEILNINTASDPVNDPEPPAPKDAVNDPAPSDTTRQEEAAGSEAWQPSTILPSFIDENLYKMSVMRDRYITLKPDLEDDIDTHVRFSSAFDVVKYTPRALQVGLLSPFPVIWFDEETGPGTALMRMARPLEMLVIYLALLSLLFGWWTWRKKPELYLAISFATAMIVSYSLVVPHLNTLNRMRYGFIMILVALGVTLFLEMLKKRREKHQPAE